MAGPFCRANKERIEPLRILPSEQVSYHAFPYWRRKLCKTGGNNVALAPITLQAEPCRSTGYGSAADQTLVLPGKRTIAVGDNFSDATLKRLLNLLMAR